MDPETQGKLTAEALVNGLEQLKQDLVARQGGSLEVQLQAGQAAVEAMKKLLGGLTDEMKS
ncbi:MAG: hypothetical protein JWM80_1707 [Cyanobacteria bacterium RYN_339]|nr:hypothetical protein [Cyanobacteria bacterium RYN_339]